MSINQVMFCLFIFFNIGTPFSDCGWCCRHENQRGSISVKWPTESRHNENRLALPEPTQSSGKRPSVGPFNQSNIEKSTTHIHHDYQMLKVLNLLCNVVVLNTFFFRTQAYFKDQATNYTEKKTFIILFVTLDHKSSLKSLGYICSNCQKCIVWVKMIDFSFMPKIFRVLSKDHVPWRYFVNFLP